MRTGSWLVALVLAVGCGGRSEQPFEQPLEQVGADRQAPEGWRSEADEGQIARAPEGWQAPEDRRARADAGRIARAPEGWQAPEDRQAPEERQARAGEGQDAQGWEPFEPAPPRGTNGVAEPSEQPRAQTEAERLAEARREVSEAAADADDAARNAAANAAAAAEASRAAAAQAAAAEEAAGEAEEVARTVEARDDESARAEAPEAPGDATGEATGEAPAAVPGEALARTEADRQRVDEALAGLAERIEEVRGSQDLEHRDLVGAIQDLADATLALSTAEDVRANVARMVEYARQIEASDPMSLDHADWTRFALQHGSDALTAIVEDTGAAMEPRLTAMRSAIEGIDVDRPLLQQTGTVADALLQMGGLVFELNRAPEAVGSR